MLMLSCFFSLIVDFLIENVERNEPMLNEHTPPAPVMTRTQQKIVTLTHSLSKEFPDFMELVQNRIEFKLFRLKNGKMSEVRIIAVISF